MSKSLLPTFSGSTVVSGLKCKDFTLKPSITFFFFKDNSLYTFYLVLHTVNKNGIILTWAIVFNQHEAA